MRLQSRKHSLIDTKHFFDQHFETSNFVLVHIVLYIQTLRCSFSCSATTTINSQLRFRVCFGTNHQLLLVPLQYLPHAFLLAKHLQSAAIGERQRPWLLTLVTEFVDAI